jgi:hypothetical protein
MGWEQGQDIIKIQDKTAKVDIKNFFIIFSPSWFKKLMSGRKRM